MDSKRPSYQLMYGQCRWGHFWNFVDCCNFTEVESREVCTVLLDKELFSQTEQCLQQNAPSEGYRGLQGATEAGRMKKVVSSNFPE